MGGCQAVMTRSGRNVVAYGLGCLVSSMLLAQLMEMIMSAVENPVVYEDLLEILAEGADLERLLAFRLPAEKQARLDALLEKNREGQLTDEDAAQLDTFEHVEHVVRLLKAHLLQKHGQ